jgi:hypothetical protein
MTTAEILTTRPDFDVPEDKKTPEWWSQNVRWYSSYYNRPPQIWNAGNYIENLTPVEKGLMYSLYYLGKQQNIDYKHITVDPSGNTMQAVWTKSKKVNNLINRLASQYDEQLNAKEISAKTFSKRAVSKKMKQWEDEMLAYDNKGKKFLEELAAAGVEYNPPYKDKFTSQDEVNKYFNYDWKDDLEEVAVLLGKHVDDSNDVDTRLIQSFINDFCPGNIMGTYSYVENGRICEARIPFYNAIYDPISEDPFMRDQRFAGFIKRYDTQQAITKWKNVLTYTEIQEIKEIPLGGVFATEFLGTYNIGNIGWWYNAKDSYMISAVTVFWLGPRDTRYVNYEDGYGNKRLKKASDGDIGDYVVTDVHYATLLGNKYLVEHGYMKNVIRSASNKSNPKLPIHYFNGNTTLSDGISIIGTIAELINKIDRCEYKIDELTGKHIGKTYAFNGNKFPEGVDMKKMSTELKTMGVTVTEPTGEPNDKTDNQPLATPMDFSLDQAIIEYSNLSVKYENMIEQLLNLPKATQGFDNQAGLGVQRGAIQQSAQGNINLWNNLFKYEKLKLQYMIDLARLVYANGEGDETAEFVVGTRGMRVLQLIKDYLFEDVMVEVSPRDVITDTQRARINDISLALAQNGGRIDITDAIDIERADTLTEARNMLDYSLRKKDQQVAAQSEEQAVQMQELQKMKNDILAALEQMKQEGMNSREQMKATTELLKQDLKNKAKTEETTIV